MENSFRHQKQGTGPRRIGLAWIMLTLMLGAGCASQQPQIGDAASAKTEPAQMTPTQFGAAPAAITFLNSEHDFVVIDFSARVMPAIGSRLSVYRNGRKIGAVRVTEPVRARFATADIIEGELQVGDEVR